MNVFDRKQIEEQELSFDSGLGSAQTEVAKQPISKSSFQVLTTYSLHIDFDSLHKSQVIIKLEKAK